MLSVDSTTKVFFLDTSDFQFWVWISIVLQKTNTLFTKVHFPDLFFWEWILIRKTPVILSDSWWQHQNHWVAKMTSYPYTSTHQPFIAVLGIQETCIKWCLIRTHSVCQFCDMIYVKEGIMSLCQLKIRRLQQVLPVFLAWSLSVEMQTNQMACSFSSHCQMGIRQVYVKIHALLVRGWWLRIRKKFSYEEIQLFSLDQVNYCGFITVIFNYWDFTTVQQWMGNY